MIEKLAHKLTRNPKIVVFIALLLLIPSIIGYFATRINYDILTYLPDELPSTQGEHLLENTFHDAATSMLIVEDMPASYSNSLINEIKKVPGVSNALWVSNMVGIQIPVDFIPASVRDIFYSEDSTMMIIQYEKAGASDETMNAIQEIRSLCNEKCFLAGFSVIIKDTKDLVNGEIPLFIIVALLLSLIAMMLTLDSFFLPVILIANIGLAVVYNMGTNVFLGEISYITKAIAAILQLGVTMDYSVFLYHRYKEELSDFEDKRDAMASAIVSSFHSLAGSSLTTVFGFLALCFMQLSLGMDIGIVMAKGVILGILTVIFILPSLILISDRMIDRFSHKKLLPEFNKITDFVIKHRRGIVILFLIMFIPAVYGETHAEVYYKLDDSLPEDMPSIVANNKLKSEYDMSTSHFVVLKDSISPTDMNRLESRIKDVDGVSTVLSYHSLTGNGIPDFFIPNGIRNMLKKDGYQLMMINSSYENASDEVNNQISEIQTILRDYDKDALLTGESALTKDMIEISSADFKTTSYISIIAILLIIAIAFRSVSVPIALVSCIELAIYLNQGIPYFTGSVTPFISPTIIGCIQLGATVDYAILMTTRFRDELRSGKDRFAATKIAAVTSAPSIITSALVLFCATFGVSLVAEIELVGNLCRMLSRGAVISAIICLFILPALLCTLEPLFAKTSLAWKKVTGKAAAV